MNYFYYNNGWVTVSHVSTDGKLNGTIKFNPNHGFAHCHYGESSPRDTAKSYDTMKECEENLN